MKQTKLLDRMAPKEKASPSTLTPRTFVRAAGFTNALIAAVLIVQFCVMAIFFRAGSSLLLGINAPPILEPGHLDHRRRTRWSNAPPQGVFGRRGGDILDDPGLLSKKARVCGMSGSTAPDGPERQARTSPVALFLKGFDRCPASVGLPEQALGRSPSPRRSSL